MKVSPAVCRTMKFVLAYLLAVAILTALTGMVFGTDSYTKVPVETVDGIQRIEVHLLEGNE